MIVLSVAALKLAVAYGTERWERAEAKGRGGQGEHDRKKGIARHTLGAEGEIAFGFWRGLYLSEIRLAVEPDKSQGDGGGAEVRTTTAFPGRLPLKPHEVPMLLPRVFVFVRKEACDEFAIVGWLYGKEIWNPAFWQSTWADPAWAAPAAELHNMTSCPIRRSRS